MRSAVLTALRSTISSLRGGVLARRSGWAAEPDENDKSLLSDLFGEQVQAIASEARAEGFTEGVRIGSEREIARLSAIVSAPEIADDLHAKALAIGLAIDMRDQPPDLIVAVPVRTVGRFRTEARDPAATVAAQPASLSGRLGADDGEEGVFDRISRSLRAAAQEAAEREGQVDGVSGAKKVAAS